MQNSNFLVTSGINNLAAITVDGWDDLYVLSSLDPSENVTVYPLADSIYGPFLLTTITLDGGLGHASGIAVHRGDLYIGRGGGWEKGLASELLAGVDRFPVFQTDDNVSALAIDSAGDLYVGNFVNGTGEVDFWGPKGGGVSLQGLSFQVKGVAVDRARGRVYLSNQPGNQVLVYSTKGTLLHTIQ